jgi:hypothetical protein
MATKNRFQLSVLQQPIFFIANPKATDFFSITPLYDDQKNLVAIKGGHVICFWKALNEVTIG